jgi:hypothetical protein
LFNQIIRLNAIIIIITAGETIPYLLYIKNTINTIEIEINAKTNIHYTIPFPLFIPKNPPVVPEKAPVVPTRQEMIKKCRRI